MEQNRLQIRLICCTSPERPKVTPTTRYPAHEHDPAVADPERKNAIRASVCVKMIYQRFNTHETPTRSKPLGSVPHLAYLSSLSLGGRAYSGLSWRIFSLSRFHPSGVPTVGHSRESNIIILCGTEYWVLVHSSTFTSPCQCSGHALCPHAIRRSLSLTKVQTQISKGVERREKNNTKTEATELEGCCARSACADRPRQLLLLARSSSPAGSSS